MQKATIARAGECSLAACLSLLAACSGQRSFTDQGFVDYASPCPSPSPSPVPPTPWLNYPPSGSTVVSTNVGEVIVQGPSFGPGGPSIVISDPSGKVPAGLPTIAPSPYPSPFATAPPQNPVAGYAHIAVPLPTLSPSTTYTITNVYTDWADNPPQCSAQYSQLVGSFTTGQ